MVDLEKMHVSDLIVYYLKTEKKEHTAHRDEIIEYIRSSQPEHVKKGYRTATGITSYLNKLKKEGKNLVPKAIVRQSLDFPNSPEKAWHDKLVALVDNMFELQKKYHDAKMERDKELYERQIKIVDVQIDRLVYDSYGLTDEEVKVVEGDNQMNEDTYSPGNA